MKVAEVAKFADCEDFRMDITPLRARANIKLQTEHGANAPIIRWSSCDRIFVSDTTGRLDQSIEELIEIGPVDGVSVNRRNIGDLI